jgi:hypothetical protein
VIDDLLPDEWPADVLAALAIFRQGHLMESPPLFFAGVPRMGVTTLVTELGDPELDDEIYELEDRPTLGMITSETCDISEGESRTPKQPFVLVAPVYEITGRVGDDALKNIQANRVGYFRQLTSSELGDGIWVADLRIEVPLDKGFLANREPIPGFETEQEYLALADFLASRRDRPVLSNELHNALVKPLRRWIEGLGSERREALMDGVQEVRLAVAGGRDDPDGASLILVADRDPLSDTVRDLWDSRWENLRGRMETAGMVLTGTAYETLDTLTARQYIESVRINLDFGA